MLDPFFQGCFTPSFPPPLPSPCSRCCGGGSDQSIAAPLSSLLLMFQCGPFPCAEVLEEKLAAWALHRLQFLLGMSTCSTTWPPMGCTVGICFATGFSTGCGGMCFSNTSSPSFLSHLGVCRAVSHTFVITPLCVLPFLRYTFTEPPTAAFCQNAEQHTRGSHPRFCQL